MKVFISSVRRGLETERDSLPGLLVAVGHTPVRFEDFPAQTVPSREACLRGVQTADVYLLLVGPVYGDPLPETGLSPTEEEYNAARSKGIPRLMFRKRDVDLEAAQAEFVRQVEAYSTGLFRDSFADAVDLQAKIVAALRDLPAPGQDARWAALPNPVTVEWRDSWAAPRSTESAQGAEIELHAVPVEQTRLSARQLRDSAEGLAQHLRSLRLVPTSSAIPIDSDKTGAWALPARPPHAGRVEHTAARSHPWRAALLHRPAQRLAATSLRHHGQPSRQRRAPDPSGTAPTAPGGHRPDY